MDDKLSSTVIFEDATATAIGQVSARIGSVSDGTYQEMMWVITRFIEGIVELARDATLPSVTHATAWQNAAQAWMSSHATVIDKLVQDHQYELSLHGAPQDLPLKRLAFVAVLQTMLAVARPQEAEAQ